MNKKEQEQLEAIERIREFVKPGDTVYTILRHVSSSGMLRVIDVKALGMYEGKPHVYHIGYNVALALGYKWDDKREGLRVGGCGMDMGYHIVYNLSRSLFGQDFTCIGEGCPSNDHTNGDPKGYEVGHKHLDSGYALNHAWM